MESISQFWRLSLALIIAIFIGCKPDPIVQDPPETPIPPVVTPDCSYSFTVAIEDTNWLPLPSPVVEPLVNYYEDHLVYDISFNPNDPNMMVVAMRGFDDLFQTYSGSILLVKDLCTGEESINNIILFSKNRGNNNMVGTIKPDGDSLTTVPYSLSQAENIRWCSDLTSFLIAKHSALSGIVRRVSLDGEVLNEDIGFYGSGFDYISNETIGYIGSGVGIFNQTIGTTELLDPTVVGGNHYDIAYSANDNALIWSVDTLVALTDKQTGQRIVLANGYHPVRYYKGVVASKIGYLAYIAELTSQSLSSPSEWFIRTEIRLINPDGTGERRLVLDFE